VKVKPYQIGAEAWFRSGGLMVYIGLDSKGKYYVRPSTTGGQHAGDYIPDPDKLDEQHEFIKDCLDSFKEIVKINQAAFIAESSPPKLEGDK
jgi:hypothetical protein